MRIKQKVVPWSDSDTQDFVVWYRSLYGDTSKETGTGELPTITEAEEKLHKRMWKRKIRFSLGNRAYRLYIHKGGRRGNYLEKIYSELFLGYFPRVRDAQHNNITRPENLGNVGQPVGEESEVQGAEE